MQIVIDIDDELYWMCKDLHGDADPVERAIANGIGIVDVLDKIKDEIEPTRKMYLEMNDIDWLNGCDYVLSILDKYKAERKGEWVTNTNHIRRKRNEKTGKIHGKDKIQESRLYKNL